MENNQLTHAGIKGMKWGVRRYQHKDGSLTLLGRMRYGNKSRLAQAKRKETLEAKKKAAEDAKNEAEEREKKKQEILNSKSGKAIYDNMDLFTTRELQDLQIRFQAAKAIKDARPEPEQVSRGKQFLEKALGIVSTSKKIVDAAGDAAKTVDKAKKLLGMDKKKDEATKDSSDKTSQKTKDTSSKQTKEKENNSSDDGPVTGKVFGEGKSHENFAKKQAEKAAKETIYDAAWKDITNTAVSEIKSDIYPEVSEIVSIGREYISGLLEEPK